MCSISFCRLTLCLKAPLCSLPSLRRLTLLLAVSFALEPAFALSFSFGPGCLETGWITTLEFCQSHKTRKGKKTESRVGKWGWGSAEEVQHHVVSMAQICLGACLSSSNLCFLKTWPFLSESFVYFSLVGLSGHFPELMTPGPSFVLGKWAIPGSPKSRVKSGCNPNQVISCGRCLAQMEDTELIAKGLPDFVCTSLSFVEKMNLNMKWG